MIAMPTSIDIRDHGGVVGIAPATALPAHYALRDRLGEGGYGVVYAAWDSKLERNVAIKCFKQAGSRVQGAGLHEARIAAALSHPAFVTVHAIEDDGRNQFIVMELVPGCTLKQTLANGPVPLERALGWVAQIADGMHYAHANGKVHGDLKPSNLMIEPGGKVRILDFGLAVRDDLLSTVSAPQNEPQGTIAYMARERFLGTMPDAQGDVYALGVILYELVCGGHPFASLSGLALVAAQMQSSSDSWNYPQDMDPQLIALVRAMTAREPGQRLGSMELVRQRLAALPGIGALPAPASVPDAHQHRALQAGGALLALALVAGAAWQWLPGTPGAAATLAPYSESREIAHGLAALKLFDRPGSIERALGHFQRVLAHSPDNAAGAAGVSLASSLRYEGDGRDAVWLRKADASAQQAIKLNEQLALSQVARGWVRDNQGQRDASLAAYDQALRIDPANFFAWYGKVRVLRHGRHYQAALAVLAEARQRFPGERVFTDELGSIHYEQADYRAAEQAFRQSIRLQPDAVVAYANLNAVLLRQNRGDEALGVLQQGLQIRPSAKLYANLGNALFLKADYLGAAQAFEHAVSPTRGAPGDYLNWANLADTLLWIPGREQAARQAYEKARQLLAPQLARAPGDVLLVSRMGLYSARAGAGEEALALIGRALALAPASADVQFRAALSYELLGRRALALASIAKARRLGYPTAFIDAEPDLVALRRDPAYPAD